MGDAVAPLDLGHQFFDAFEHRIDNGGEHVQFVASIGQGEAVGEVSGDDGFWAGLGFANLVQRTVTQEMPAGGTGNNRQRQRP